MLKCFPHTNIIMTVRRLFLTCVVGFHTLRWFLSYFIFFTHEFSSFFFSIAAARRTRVYYFVLYVVSCHLYALLS